MHARNPRPAIGRATGELARARDWVDRGDDGERVRLRTRSGDLGVAGRGRLPASGRSQLTPLRRRVLDIFSGSVAPLGAYAILEELSRREGKHVAPPTVYRTLDFFLEHGFVHKIESLNAYAPCEHLDHAHHGMLLICEACGRSEEIEDAERDARDRRTQRRRRTLRCGG